MQPKWRQCEQEEHLLIRQSHCGIQARSSPAVAKALLRETKVDLLHKPTWIHIAGDGRKELSPLLIAVHKELCIDDLGWTSQQPLKDSMIIAVV